MSQPALIALIFICGVAAPIAWFGWLWFFEPRPLFIGIVTYGLASFAIIAIVWAADAPFEYALVAFFLLILAALKVHLQWAGFGLLRMRERQPE